MITPYHPTAREEDAAVRLVNDLLAHLDAEEQLNVLALSVRLWCYHRETLRKAECRSLAEQAKAVTAS
jgi:hypothetical protein